MEKINKSHQRFNDFMQESANPEYLHCFGHKAQLQTWTLRAALGFLNGIIQTMYGYSLTVKTRKKSDRNKYSIRHEYLGDIFATEICEGKPYIIPGWYKRLGDV